ncbi:MAG: hypothetical protein K2W80_04940 [Burkholderiales bacterium]|nr:hypothetical protein [Burkholderiales bacterium]
MENSMFRSSFPSPFTRARGAFRGFAAAVCVAATLSFSAPATASLVQNAFANGSLNVTIERTGRPDQNVRAGGFTGVFAGSSFLSYCIELAQNFKFGVNYTNYTVVPLASAPTNAPMGATKAMHLALLVGKNFTDSFTSTIKTAAMQLAIWEIVHETNSTYSVTNGHFKVDDGNNDVNQARTLANTWLGELSGLKTMASLVTLSSPTNQDFITTVVPVPPSALLLGSGLLLGMWGIRRRRTEA